jgi:uncharacterized repeat protein (TIGR01451 family)/predicted ribosomally synthesized peptide with SipW-like signal peptide
MRRPLTTHPVQLRLFDVPAPSGGRSRVRRRSTPLRAVLSVVALGIATAGIMSGSYAAWTAQTTNPGNQVVAGTLTMSNDKDATSVFSASNVSPGDTGSSTVTVQNTGSLPMTVALTQDQLTSTGIEASLRLSIHDDTRNWCVYPTNLAGSCGSRGSWNASLTSFPMPATSGAAQWPAGQSHTFTLSWELVTASPNSDQGKTGSFRLVWDGTQ